MREFAMSPIVKNEATSTRRWRNNVNWYIAFLYDAAG
jgi:hypothetical protein